MVQINPSEIFESFGIKSPAHPFGDGHINTTYVDDQKRYILQRINTSIFPDAEKLMGNIQAVTDFVREKVKLAGGDPDRETLTVVPTKSGKPYFTADDGTVWRMYTFIKDSYSVTLSKDTRELYEAGKAFGRFQCMLSDFPAEKLYESIKNFHNTPWRLENLKKAIADDLAGRVKDVKKEIDFALSREADAHKVVDGIANGEIPLRVTHNDTKLNNVLFDKATDKGLCVIDLDTVMAGSMLYDFGDTLRSGAATAAEDEQNLELVKFDLEAFKAFAEGFLSETLDVLTKREIELLPFSAKLMTYECGCRFLTDHLNGDTYFKIHREGHNLDRARAQFALVQDIERKQSDMKKIVDEIIARGV